LKEPRSRDGLAQRIFPRRGELKSDENHEWKSGAFSNMHIFRKISSSMADDEVIDLDAVGKSEFPISRNDLNFHAIMVIVDKCSNHK